MPPPAPPAPAAEELPTAQPLPVATIPASRAPNELPAAHIPAQPSSTPAPQAEESPSPIPPDFNAPPVAGSVAIPPAATDLPTSLTSKPDSSAPGFPAAAASIAPVAPLEFKKRKRSKAPLMVAAALMLTAAGAAAWFLPASKEFIAAKIESFRSQSKEDQPPPIATTEQSSELSAAPATPTPTEAPSPPSDSELNTFNETPIPEAIPADVTDIPAAGAPTNRPTPPKANTNSIHDIVYEFDEENSLLKAPREALASFLGAPNWQERAKYVQSLDRVSPLMQKYYSENRDGPIFANTVTFQNSERVPGNDSMFFLFHITTDKVPEGFPVSVEETKNGMRIDWEAFVEFNDKLLFGFLNKYQEEPQRFHVIMRRAHYFGPGVPDLEEKYAFRIEPPIPGYQGYAFVDRDDAIVQNKLSYQLEWHAISYPIVELQWKRNTETLQQYVTIKDIVQNNWRAEKKTEDSVVADQ